MSRTNPDPAESLFLGEVARASPRIRREWPRHPSPSTEYYRNESPERPEGERERGFASLAFTRAPSCESPLFPPPSLLPPSPYLREMPLIDDVDSRRRRRDPKRDPSQLYDRRCRARSDTEITRATIKKNGIYRKSQSRRPRPLANYN